MGYTIRKRYLNQKGEIIWRLLFTQETTTKRIERHVRIEEYANLGFSPSMTFDEAKAVAKQLSSIAKINQDEARRNKIQAKLDELNRIECAWIPDNMSTKFVEEILKNRVCWGEENGNFKQLNFYWNTARKLIIKLNKCPSTWFDNRNSIYAVFKNNKWSVSYAHKVIRVLNLYGKFYAKTFNKFYEEIPKPTGEAAAKIHESFYNKNPRGLTSKELTWAKLTKCKTSLSEKNFNWLHLSLWLGLRPSEITNLKYKVETQNKIKVLAIYQHKLVRLAPEQRWKFIPLLCTQQLQALKIIEEQNYSQPLLKIMHKYLGEEYSLRAGRKGFVNLMWDELKIPKHISFRWLGHKTMRTTDNHYTQGMQQALEFDITKLKRAS